ncbi:hypothetical protein [Mycobacterium kyogaense]|uniref:hypothetical protein n=1 Tax=Mycobacterium kyogaense TaxID=2212479 RepID=UPI000DAD0330|nr:hypothetical protein [Mycobacterium kyogaense]
MWFWAAVITLGSVIALWVGSQVAVWMGQNVDWYTGFGQWLGALSSLIAAGAALWIAVSDRRQIDARTEADLKREAALVRVEITKYRPDIWHDYDIPGIKIENRRSNRIFDIKLIRLATGGSDRLSDTSLDEVEFHLGSQGQLQELSDPAQPLDTDQSLNILIKTFAIEQTDYVAVQYTDSSGRRWEVDTDGRVRRM